MQLVALLVWLALIFLVAKVVNYLAKRSLMNPWTWFAASYAVLYVVGVGIGAASGSPDLAYLAGYQLPITLVAIAIGVWRAPKWRQVHKQKRLEPSLQNSSATHPTGPLE